MPEYDEYEVEVSVRMIKRYKVHAPSLERAKQIVENRLDAGVYNPYTDSNSDGGTWVRGAWDYD